MNLLRPTLATILSGCLLIAGGPAFASTATEQIDAPAPTAEPTVTPTPEGEPEIPEVERDALLGSEWQSSDDKIWTAIGDQAGYRILSASQSEGYAWHNVATLTVPGIETDRWIGNFCVTGDKSTMAVVYGPRNFTNHEDLFNRGAFGSLVDLASGAVTHLEPGFSLASFNPGCGSGTRATFTSFAQENVATRILSVENGGPVQDAPIEVQTQVTSAVPGVDGPVGAVGGSIVKIGEDGSLDNLAATIGTASGLQVNEDGGLSFIEIDDQLSSAKYIGATNVEDQDPSTLATAPLGDMKIDRSSGGLTYITGEPSNVTDDLPSAVQVADTPVGSVVSSDGELALVDALQVVSPEADQEANAEGPDESLEISAKVLANGSDVRFVAGREVLTAAPASSPPEAPRQAARGVYGPGSDTNPVESERACAVPRNDANNQALQPKPRQVEWAVDQAIFGVLTDTRDADWKHLGMPQYSPQGLFPKPTLIGGGHIPAQVMLGVLAQESNLWQASTYTTPGVTGNPLIGNFYGNDRYADEGTFWDINFEKADCGYGVAQVTDGMRLAGRERPNEVALPYDSQRAIALDYAANVAKGVQMLGDKWNETKAAGITINNGDPSSIENWFAAVWAYNTGFHPNAGDGQPWGLGWANNPQTPSTSKQGCLSLMGAPPMRQAQRNGPTQRKSWASLRTQSNSTRMRRLLFQGSEQRHGMRVMEQTVSSIAPR
jgi:hypothetical protein